MVPVLALFATIAAESAESQQREPPFYYPRPAASAVRVTRGVRFATADTLPLTFDIYRPARASARLPVLIFYSLFWPEDNHPRRSSEWEPWGSVAAGNGIVAIMPQLRGEPGTGNATVPARVSGDDFDRLIGYLREHATHLNIDINRVAIYSASGAVASALVAAEDSRQTAIKAAVMYYGAAEVDSFRQDVPVLFVRAGLDHAGMNRSLDQLVARAVAQNAPVTLLNHQTGHHAFEYLDDTEATRQIITQTIEFVKRATDPAYQALTQAKQIDARAAAYLLAENYHQAALAYEELLRLRPEDGWSRFPYAEALLADKQYSAACTQFNLMKGNFAVIFPGTRSCVLAGSADRAIALLQSMPKDWLTSENQSGLRTDAVFQPLWSREDFKALFR